MRALSSVVLLIVGNSHAFITSPSRRKALMRQDIAQWAGENRKSSDLDWDSLSNQASDQAKELFECIQLATEPFLKSDDAIEANDIVRVCDTLEQNNLSAIRRWALERQRYELLAKLMRKDYNAYIATALFLSPSRIPRLELPNLQDVPYDPKNEPTLIGQDGLVEDCTLDDMKYKDSPLDKLLLSIFRHFVTVHTGGVKSETAGIEGLVEEARTYLLQPNQTAAAQQEMVRSCLASLMTPALPPFYRIFMSGIVPKVGTEWDGKQIGPWFYAPFLTSFVTPAFFGFLVGPSRPNRRKDGQLGGLVVEKCKFLQISGCKGICLHQCKLPAQQFFKDELGLPLTVVPNFATQECQWSFGQEPVPASEDPDFPEGCLRGCPSRQAIAATGSNADVCNE